MRSGARSLFGVGHMYGALEHLRVHVRVPLLSVYGCSCLSAGVSAQVCAPQGAGKFCVDLGLWGWRFSSLPSPLSVEAVHVACFWRVFLEK